MFDMTTLKVGDKVRHRDGTVSVLTHVGSDVSFYPYIFSLSGNKEEVYTLTNRNGEWVNGYASKYDVVSKVSQQKYWMVHSKGPTRVKHYDKTGAVGEARRLAKKHPDQTFTVLEAVSIHKANKTVTWEYHDEEI